MYNNKLDSGQRTAVAVALLITYAGMAVKITILSQATGKSYQWLYYVAAIPVLLLFFHYVILGNKR